MRDKMAVRLLLAAADFLLINAAFVLAYWLRYYLGLGGDPTEENFVYFDSYFPALLGLNVILMPAYFFAGLYNGDSRRTLFDESSKILATTSIGMMFGLAVLFLQLTGGLSRLMFFYFWALAVLALVLVRVLRRLLVGYLRRSGRAVRRVLVVGANRTGRTVMHVLSTERGHGYRLVGFVDDEYDGNLGRFKCLGPVRAISDIVDQQRVEEVIVALPLARHHEIVEIMDHCHRTDLEFRLVPDLLELSLSRCDIEDLRGVPLIGVKAPRIEGGNLFTKRALDVSVSLLFLLLSGWLVPLIALAIRLDSPGPVMFRQKRIGRGGRPFTVYKFRSMHVDAEARRESLLTLNEADGPLFKIRRDPRLTRMGRVLRRLSLDEYPQLLNVLRGDMSLVGPRPALGREVCEYEDWQNRRLDAAPGLTGLWQVSGRSELPFEEMVLLDIYYIENWSLGLDLRILLRTLPAVLTGRGAF